MFDFLQAVVDGILFGTTYSLIGIGFTLVFGVMHKINMSYASVSIGAAYAGLLGTNKRTADREADKPYVFVHAKGGNWQVLYNPL